jgi:hypothetical protein
MLGSSTLSGIYLEKVLLQDTLVIIHGTVNYKCVMEQYFFRMNFGKSAAP